MCSEEIFVSLLHLVPFLIHAIKKENKKVSSKNAYCNNRLSPKQTEVFLVKEAID